MNENWSNVDSGNVTVVYSCKSADMTALHPGDSTSVQSTQMIMKSITKEYVAIDDINITITGYAMRTGAVYPPTDA